jgi:hypothetical protein
MRYSLAFAVCTFPWGACLLVLLDLLTLPDNHKPALSSADAPDRARLKPSIPGKISSYDLNFADDDGNYAFSGSRTTDDDQYVLYFDQERKAFVLDKVDSTFNMNLTRMPGNSDADDLSRRYSHIDLDKPAKDTSSTAAKSTGTAAKAKPAPAPKTQQKASTHSKPKPAEKKQQSKRMELPLPKPEPAKPKKSKFEEDEDEDEDDDGGLLIEYPGGEPPARKNDFSPAFPTQRRFDDYMDQRESEADDEEGESDDEPDTNFKLPSPVNKGVDTAAEPENKSEAANGANEDHDDDDGATADLEGDLENALEIAFEDLANSQEDSRGGDESEISEED